MSDTEKREEREEGAEGATQAFYDALAPDFHLLFEDWQSGVDWQGAFFDRLLREHLGDSSLRVLDIACGMGTQALGLAAAGHHVCGRDLSPALVARAEAEAARRGLNLDVAVADMREPPPPEREGAFDAVLAIDNALPHLLEAADLEAALCAACSALRPEGLFLASIRDYDRLRQERPAFDPPRLRGQGPDRRVILQVWTWHDPPETYDFEHLLLFPGAEGQWQVRARRARYRALLRAELERAAHTAGLVDPRWHEPEDTGFYQPLFSARRGVPSGPTGFIP